MWSEAGMVAIAPPRIQQVTGSVASALTGVSATPTRPLIATSAVLLVNSIAWQAASSPTLRPVLVIYTVVAYNTTDPSPNQTLHDLHAGRPLVRLRPLRTARPRA